MAIDFLHERPYTDEALDEIIRAAGGLPPEQDRQALEDRLSDALWYWDTLRWKKSSEPLTSLELAKRFQNIETAASRLLVALECGPDGDIDKASPQIIHGGLALYAAEHAEAIARKHHHRLTLPGKAVLAQTVKSVAQLKRWAAAARSDAEGGGSLPRSERNTGNEALDALFSCLLEIYAEVFELEPGISRVDGGMPSGPCFRYVKACLDPHLKAIFGEEPPSDEAIVHRLRRLKRSIAGSSRNKL